jgi:hypothetical protein
VLSRSRESIVFAHFNRELIITFRFAQLFKKTIWFNYLMPETRAANRAITMARKLREWA